MKTKNYRNGRVNCKSYKKPAGKGWEVGFNFGSKTIFVGNFIHSKEANQWWTTMNREITTFSKRYKVTPKFSKTRYSHFLSSHLYHKYYQYLNRLITGYKKNWNKVEAKDFRQYRTAHKKVAPNKKIQLLKAA